MFPSHHPPEPSASRGGSRDVRAVDSHAHVFLGSLPFTPRARHAPDYDATPGEYLGLLDAHDVSHGVLVQPSFLGTDNGYMLGVLRAHPGRLRGVAVVDPGTPFDQLQALADAGIRGLRLNLVGLPMPDLSRPVWQTLLQHVRALDWHVELHRPSQDLPAVGQPVLDAGCKLVVDHFGRPGENTAADSGFGWLVRAAAHGRTWVKLSAAYRNWRDPLGPEARRAAGSLLDACGPQRLLWGSDWPHTQHREHTGYAHTRAALNDWIPDADARRCILVDTPAALFGFSKETTP
ncbi:amidohydrolase family protein [Variovorax paradoxus]|uniref:amidohydrolase family protein n=1 Tax=Variovorax paradoxus TaxID=34073 RepID=UPI000649533C|nr:amidohydrolase family protein [Variovorax paradoxus]